MSKIGKRWCAAGSAPDHAHKTVSESRCAQELEEHRFLYDLAGAATPGRRHRRSPRSRSGRTDRQPRGIRTRVHQGAVARPADPRTQHSGLHPDLLRQEVRQERRTRGTVEGPRLPARGRHPRRPVTGPARPFHPGPHRDRVRPAQARHRLHLAARGTRHDHARRAPGLPRVRGARGVHPRTHRAGHQRGPGRRPRPRRPTRPPAGDDGGTSTSRPRPARPENTVTSIAKLLGVSTNTIYDYVPEPKGGRLALAEATSTPELPQPTRSED